MFCENCGSKIPDGAEFCSECGSRIKSGASAKSMVKNDKNMIIALIISFLLTGLGIFYAGNRKKGIIFFIAGLIFAFLGRAIPLCSVVAIGIWAYALYETYNEVKKANGQENPNIIQDIRGFPTSKKIAALFVIAVIFLIVVGGVITALMPSPDTTSDDADLYDDSYNYNMDDASSSDSSGYSSSSSDGYGTHSHYEGEHGSSDTYGTVNDDGSVDAYQTGHTDYGDYEINSHMDSDGKVHGTVNVGGKTYYVDN